MSATQRPSECPLTTGRRETHGHRHCGRTAARTCLLPRPAINQPEDVGRDFAAGAPEGSRHRDYGGGVGEQNDPDSEREARRYSNPLRQGLPAVSRKVPQLETHWPLSPAMRTSGPFTLLPETCRGAGGEKLASPPQERIDRNPFRRILSGQPAHAAGPLPQWQRRSVRCRGCPGCGSGTACRLFDPSV